MYSTIVSGAVRGICSYLIVVEVDTSQGLPSFEMVGTLSSEVREARERVKVALKNTGFQIPPMRITVNLSPADLRKEGTGFDLPIAVALLKSMGIIPVNSTEDILFLGELGLNGELHPTPGVLPIVQEAKKQNLLACIVPKGNEAEGAVIDGISVYGMQHIREVLSFLQAAPDARIAPARSKLLSGSLTEPLEELDFADIQGQEMTKRAVEIAAAGFHHLLMIGPPGSGKTMIAKRIPTILPPMNLRECLEVSTIYSVAGLLSETDSIISKRPFLSPHHSTTTQAIAGGGAIPRPGAVSLAHRGVLFLDELAEFNKQTLDILRQPLEDRQIQIVRSQGTFSYPADFLMVGAMNPCPCGYYPDMNRCTCTQSQVNRYLGHISGPILDRMDIVVEAPKISIDELNSQQKGEGSREIRKRILSARAMQEKRFSGTGLRFNSEMGSKQIHKYCPLTVPQQQLLSQVFSTLSLSARAYHKVIKVARTIADLDASDSIELKHLTEAVCYRSVDQKYWGKENRI